MTSAYLPGIAGAGDLVAELAAIAAGTGANTGLWPGLTIRIVLRPAGLHASAPPAAPGPAR